MIPTQKRLAHWLAERPGNGMLLRVLMVSACPADRVLVTLSEHGPVHGERVVARAEAPDLISAIGEALTKAEGRVDAPLPG